MTDWVPGLVALGSGVVIGAAALGLSRGRKSASSVEEEKKVLAERLGKALEHLRELDADRHHYSDEEFAAAKNRLELEAAAALRAQDAANGRKITPVGVKGAAAKTASVKKANQEEETVVAAPKGMAGRHPQLVGALWGGAVVLFFAVAFFLVNTDPGRPGAMGGGGGDSKYEALLVLSSIALSQGDYEKILGGWQLYMQQPVPRRRPPMLKKAYDWLEKAIDENAPADDGSQDE